MSQTTTLEPCGETGIGALTMLAAAATRVYAAYIAWRLERTAIAALHAMSDRALSDIGLTRSEIAGAVRGTTARPPACASEC